MKTKLWHFDIGLNNGQVATIEAPSFEIAFRKLRTDSRFNGKWSLLKFEEKLPEDEPTTKELKKQSEELWSKICYEDLRKAGGILKKNFEAFQAAVDFDNEHPCVISINPMAHANDVCMLKHAENCIDEFHLAYDC